MGRNPRDEETSTVNSKYYSTFFRKSKILWRMFTLAVISRMEESTASQSKSSSSASELSVSVIKIKRK